MSAAAIHGIVKKLSCEAQRGERPCGGFACGEFHRAARGAAEIRSPAAKADGGTFGFFVPSPSADCTERSAARSEAPKRRCARLPEGGREAQDGVEYRKEGEIA